MLFTLKRIILWAFSVFLTFLLGLGAVAFITLLERKLLGLTQNRLGPNKVTLFGLFQPMADGIKLLRKQFALLRFSQPRLFLISPSTLLVLFVLRWTFVIPWNGSPLLLKYTRVFLFSLLGIRAYGVMISGWSVTRLFSKLGSVRGLLQRLSFGAALIIVFLFALRLFKRFFLRTNYSRTEVFLLWRLLWVTISLIESNRAPFDLLEGERELISGFNVEIGSSIFVLLFLREYGMLIILVIITNIILIGNVNFFCVVVIRSALFIRSCFPRIRYDALIGLMWQSILSFRVLAFVVSRILY